MHPVIVNSPVAILLQYCNIQANSARVLKKKKEKKPTFVNHTVVLSLPVSVAWTIFGDH